MHDERIPHGYCHCGCGQQAPIARNTSTKRGWVAGEPLRYVHGHNRRKPPRAPHPSDYRADPETGCWLWQHSISANGYGSYSVQGRPVWAHRWYYEQHKGPIPEGLHLDHLCRNPPCVNPDHLESVTPAENARRGARGVLLTHCPHGHAYDEANTYIRPDTGGRQCRACSRQRQAREIADNREYVNARARAAYAARKAKAA